VRFFKGCDLVPGVIAMGCDAEGLDFPGYTGCR
jgi:hypothetical protein